MHRIHRWCALVLLVLFAPASMAESGIVEYRSTLTPRAQESYDKKVDGYIDWIHDMMVITKREYQKPTTRPKIYHVSRDYIMLHRREICFSAKTDEEVTECAERVYGWIDDARTIYVLRESDVLRTKGFPGSTGFPTELWQDMELVHEIVHFIQLEGSTMRVSALPCATEEKWETEAYFLMTQWLHGLRQSDAERINAIFRGQMLRFQCASTS